MKVFSCPDEVPFDEPNYTEYDPVAEDAREREHGDRLKAWMIARGDDGPRTGMILHEGVADGAAAYMFADGRSAYLIHLPYGDAYHSHNIPHLPKKEIIRRLDMQNLADDVPPIALNGRGLRPLRNAAPSRPR